MGPHTGSVEKESRATAEELRSGEVSGLVAVGRYFWTAAAPPACQSLLSSSRGRRLQGVKVAALTSSADSTEERGARRGAEQRGGKVTRSTSKELPLLLEVQIKVPFWLRGAAHGSRRYMGGMLRSLPGERWRFCSELQTPNAAVMVGPDF